ncbi:MAG: hypothetical protein RLP44_00640 [Aggregatilineales bacterium]
MMNKTRFTRMMVMIFAVVTALIGAGSVSAQAMGLTYTSLTLNATCNSVTINYNVTNTSGISIFMYATIVGPGTYLSETDAPANNGANTAVLNFPALANGEALEVRASLPPNIIVSGPVTCGAGGGTSTGGGTTVGGGSSGGGAGSGAGGGSGPWGGYTDGRVNPDPAEAYTIFCAYDRVFVHGDLPENRRLVAQIHIEVLLAMDSGRTYNFDDWKVSRQGNVIVIQGENGYYRPEWRSKTFNLYDCLARNVVGLGTYNASGEPNNGVGFPEYRTYCVPLAIIFYPSRSLPCAIYFTYDSNTP